MLEVFSGKVLSARLRVAGLFSPRCGFRKA